MRFIMINFCDIDYKWFSYIDTETEESFIARGNEFNAEIYLDYLNQQGKNFICVEVTDEDVIFDVKNDLTIEDFIDAGDYVNLEMEIEILSEKEAS